MSKPRFFAHSTAEVSPSARIGGGTKIWHQAQVREKAVVGRNCVISKNVYIAEGVKIGDRVKIQNNVSVYRGVTVQDDVLLGPHCITTNDLRPRAFISKFKVYPTLIKKGASVGAGAIIVCGNTVGEYALVGAGSVVTRDVPPHGLVVGNPARLIGFVCKCGNNLVKLGEDKNRVVMKCVKCSETTLIPLTDFKKVRERK